MKILYLGNFTQPHCTEVHLAATLESLGHTVIRHQERHLGTVRNIEGDFDLFLWTRTWRGYVTQELLDNLKSRGIPTVSYHLDLYVGLQREEGLDTDLFWKTDFVFTPDGDPKSAEVFAMKGINHVYMPPGVYAPECVYGTPRDQFKHDVVFVGGSVNYHREDWPYRMKLINWLKDTYGERFAIYGHPHPTIRNQELNDLYASAKVVVGDSLCKDFTHERYWSDRVYETTGRGGFLIHPYIKGLEDQFKLYPTKPFSGQELVTYEFDDFDGLGETINYFLEHEAEREAIRKAGHERTKLDHTYHNRMAKMLEVVNVRG